MLVLSRHLHEGVEARFTIVDPKTGKHKEVKLRISVVDIRGDKVRLGFEDDTGDPDLLPIHRDEVWRQIDADARRRSGT